MDSTRANKVVLAPTGAAEVSSLSLSRTDSALSHANARSSFQKLVEEVSAEEVSAKENAAKEASDATANADAEARRRAAAKKAYPDAEETAAPELEVFIPCSLPSPERSSVIAFYPHSTAQHGPVCVLYFSVPFVFIAGTHKMISIDGRPLVWLPFVVLWWVHGCTQSLLAKSRL